MCDTLEQSLARMTRSILGSVGAATQLLYTAEAETEEDRAIKSWTIYSCVMILDFGHSVLTCFEASQARAMVVLTRSMYEFYITGVYFERHRDVALKQLQTVLGRRLLRFSNGPFQNEQERIEAKTRYQEWAQEAKNKGLDPYAGNVSFRTMALEVEGETDECCPTYSTRYGLASIFSHPDGAGVPDVLHIEGDRINVAWKSNTIDRNLQLLLANDILLATARMLKERFNSYMTDYDSLHERQSALQEALLVTKGVVMDSPSKPTT